MPQKLESLFSSEYLFSSPVKASGRAGLEECNLTPPPAGKLESRLEGRKAAFKNLSGGLRFHLFLLFPSSHEMAYFSGRILDRKSTR